MTSYRESPSIEKNETGVHANKRLKKGNLYNLNNNNNLTNKLTKKNVYPYSKYSEYFSKLEGSMNTLKYVCEKQH
jgi:hypothetical protein